MHAQTRSESRFGIYCIATALLVAFTFFAVVSTAPFAEAATPPGQNSFVDSDGDGICDNDTGTVNGPNAKKDGTGKTENNGQNGGGKGGAGNGGSGGGNGGSGNGGGNGGNGGGNGGGGKR